MIAWVNLASLYAPDGYGFCSVVGCNLEIVSKMGLGLPEQPNRNGWRLLKEADNQFWFILGTANGASSGAPNVVRSKCLEVVPERWYHVAAVKGSALVHESDCVPIFPGPRLLDHNFPMSKRSKVHPSYKSGYRVTNWPAYDRGLAQRGSLTVWFSPEAIKAWKPKQSGLRGGQHRYSDVAVRTALHLRLLLGLAWRQTEGLLQSLVDLIGLDLEVPDHTTLSRRSRDLATVRFRYPSSRSIHLIVDASGLKVYGQGEWAATKYGRRFPGTGWRKLHLAVDDAGSIVAAELTDNDAADASVFPTLLRRVGGKIVRLTADGAYDRREVYAAARRRGAHVVVPPRRGAVLSHDTVLETRNRHIKHMARVGRARWRQEQRQHCQARVENAFYRYKRIFGPSLRARSPNSQRVEMMTACGMLNRMSSLGMPISHKLAA